MKERVKVTFVGTLDDVGDLWIEVPGDKTGKAHFLWKRDVDKATEVEIIGPSKWILVDSEGRAWQRDAYGKIRSGSITLSFETRESLEERLGPCMQVELPSVDWVASPTASDLGVI